MWRIDNVTYDCVDGIHCSVNKSHSVLHVDNTESLKSEFHRVQCILHQILPANFTTDESFLAEFGDDIVKEETYIISCEFYTVRNECFYMLFSLMWSILSVSIIVDALCHYAKVYICDIQSIVNTIIISPLYLYFPTDPTYPSTSFTTPTMDYPPSFTTDYPPTFTTDQPSTFTTDQSPTLLTPSLIILFIIAPTLSSLSSLSF